MQYLIILFFNFYVDFNFLIFKKTDIFSPHPGGRETSRNPYIYKISVRFLKKKNIRRQNLFTISIEDVLIDTYICFSVRYFSFCCQGGKRRKNAVKSSFWFVEIKYVKKLSIYEAKIWGLGCFLAYRTIVIIDTQPFKQ